MSKSFHRMLLNTQGRALGRHLGRSFRPRGQVVQGVVVDANRVRVGGVEYPALNLEGLAPGQAVTLRNVGRPGNAVFAPDVAAAPAVGHPIVGGIGGGGGGGGGGNVVPAQVDYVLREESGQVIATDGLTGQVVASGTDHRAVIQQVIDLAGVGGNIAFRRGEYWLNGPIRPLARQTWFTPFAAVFHPTGDNRIVEAVDLDWWVVYGCLHIEDTARNTSSAEAIYLDGISGCYIQDIMVWDYYRGMAVWGLTRRCYENVFDSIRLNIVRHEGLVIKAEVGDNYFGSLFIKGPSTVEWATGSGLMIGLYPSAGTIFGGIMFNRVEVLDCLVNLDLQGLVEVWFDQLLLDNAYAQAMFVGDQVKRLFVDRVWVAGSGNGVWIEGSAASKVRQLSFNHIFSWVNAEYGIHFNGFIDGVRIGHLHCLENQVAQVKFSRGQISNVWIDKLTVEDSNKVAVDVGGIDGPEDNCGIGHAEIDGGECMGLDLFAHLEGRRAGKPFRNRGVAYIPAGQSFVTVSHGLEGRPLYVQLTPHHFDARQAFVSYYDDVNFLIDASYNVPVDARVAWEARSGVEIGGELLANPDAEGNPPANWVSYNGAPVETVDVYSGSTALRINGGFHEWKSDPFTAVAGGRYRISGYVKGTGNPFTELTLRFWQVTGGWVVLYEGKIPLTSVFDYADDGYVRVQGDFTAPAGTESADVTFRCTAAPTTDVYADDFEFRPQGGSNLLANNSVETGSSAPDGWTLNGVTWESGVARTGSRSLRVVHDTVRKEARANWVNVVAGGVYEAGAWLQGQASGNVAFVVQWYSDAGGIGNLIREDVHYVNGNFPSWTWVQATVTAPANAASAYFAWRMEAWNDFDLKADLFSVRQLI